MEETWPLQILSECNPPPSRCQAALEEIPAPEQLN